MRFSEYARLDATGLAALIRGGEVQRSEVWETAVAAIETINSELNAVAEGPWPQPLAHTADGVFAGVPFAIKDILCHAEGILTRMGTRMLGEGIRPPSDTELMARFRRAGLATLCTTTTPEFALNVATESLLDGPTRNPWKLVHGAGGSSGGAAALVAAGALPCAHGNDGAGSIRIPAAHTGLIGLKPSRGRVPLGPDCQEVMYGLATEFALTRTVRDTARLLDAVAGWAPGEKQSISPPEQPWCRSFELDPPPLKVAVCLASWAGNDLEPSVAAAVQSTARTLEMLSHRVDCATPAFDWSSFLSALTTTWCAGTAAILVPLVTDLKLSLSTVAIEHTTRACLEHGRRLSPVELGVAMGTYNQVSRTIGAFLEDWDVLLTPVGVGAAPKTGYFNANDPTLSAEAWVEKIASYYPFTAPFNVTGGPAISIPIGLTADGRPVGVQLAAQFGAEDTLLRVAAQLEQTDIWNRATPLVHVSRWN